MTDKEIVKAWEKVLSTGDAPIGEHWSVGGIVTTQLAKETFDLINRLQDEREALINGQETLQNTIVEQKAEIERLKCLVEEADSYFSEGSFTKGLAVFVNLVKEMTESVNYGSSKKEIKERF